MSASSLTPPSDASAPSAPTLLCRLCGHEHRRAPLRPGHRALCTRCGALLAQRGWLGRDAPLALTFTAFILAIPSVLLPLVSVDKVGRERVGYLFTGTEALWDGGMRLLAIWVLLCGTLAPLLLLGTLLGLLLPEKMRWPVAARATLLRAAHALEHWSMPEVYVLAVLVALTKLGTLVNVHVEPGFWCYAAMSLTLLAAWRSFDLATLSSEPPPSNPPVPSLLRASALPRFRDSTPPRESAPRRSSAIHRPPISSPLGGPA